MGSHAQDQSTQSAASKAAQSSASTAAANSTAANARANAAYGQLFPANGGPGLNSAFQNTYNATANVNAAGAQNAVQQANQQQANQGGGATPTGFNADQQRQAYQTMAGQNAGNYANLGMQQAQALQNYGNNQANLGYQYNANDAATNTNLYGTASQQKQSGWGSVLGGISGLAGAAATAYAGR